MNINYRHIPSMLAFLDMGAFSHAVGGGEQHKVGMADFTWVQGESGMQTEATFRLI